MTAKQLDSIVKAHQSELWSFLRYLGCDPDEASDLAQETFLGLLEGGFDERNPRSTSAYLRRSAERLLLARLRRVSPRLSQLAQDWGAFVDVDQGYSGRQATLKDCLGSLPARARKALNLRYVEGQSRSEIARSLGIGEEALKSLLQRSKSALRACIEKRHI